MRNSILPGTILNADPEDLCDGLLDIWNDATQILEDIFPAGEGQITEQKVTALIESMQDVHNLATKKFLRHLKKLDKTRAMYAPEDEPIDVASVNRTLFRVRRLSEIGEGDHRPDDILYRGNLAWAVGQITRELSDNAFPEQFDASQHLRILTKSLFSRLVKSSAPKTAGSTTMSKPTFDLALTLQTQTVIADLEDLQNDSDSHSDPATLIRDAFYDDSGSTLKGWDVDGLRGKDLIKSQRDTIVKRLDYILKNVDSLEELENTFPVTLLVQQFLIWVQDRDSEIRARIYDGPEVVQEAIEAELQRRNTERRGLDVEDEEDDERERSNHLEAGTRSGVQPAAARAIMHSSHQAGPSSSTQSRVSAARNQSNVYGTEVLAFSSGQHSRHVNRADNDNYDFDGTLDPALSAKGLADNAFRATQSSAQENLEDYASRGLHYVEESPRLSHPYPSATSGKGKHRLEEPVDDEDDDDPDPSQDTGFEKVPTPKVIKMKRRRTGATSHALRQPLAPKIPLRPAFQLHEDEDEDGEAAAPAPPSTAMQRQLLEVNAIAKQVTKNFNERKPPQKRTFWTTEEDEQLLTLIAELGISWALIKKTDESNENIMDKRDQVALKDRARNIKFSYVKYVICQAYATLLIFYRSSTGLPQNLELVALKTDQKKALANLEIAYDGP